MQWNIASSTFAFHLKTKKITTFSFYHSGFFNY
nr:MAG TPA: hypothetical protein [Caudoviricetes sp.]